MKDGRKPHAMGASLTRPLVPSSAVPFLNFIITGCTTPALESFKARVHLDRVTIAPEGDKLVCSFPSDQLDDVFGSLESEARKGWQAPDDTAVLAFASAFFPCSRESIQPMRQLRGQVAARLARKSRSLPPARALPRGIFGANEAR